MSSSGSRTGAGVQVQPLVPQLPGGATPTCQAPWKQLVFVGTSDGHVLQYRVAIPVATAAEDTAVDTAQIPTLVLDVKRLVAKGVGRPVSSVAVIPAVGMLVVLCDGVVTLHNAQSLDPALPKPVSKGVSRILTHLEAPRFATVVKSRVSVFSLDSGAISKLRELSLPFSAPLAGDWIGQTFVWANSKQYVVQDATSGASSALFTFERSTPVIARISKDELLLSNDVLGIFVNAQGMPSRGNVLWSKPPIAMAARPPYLYSVLPNSLEIHTLDDQKQRARLPWYTGGGSVPDGVARLPPCVTIACTSDVCVLGTQVGQLFHVQPLSLMRQIRELIRAGQVEEAIELFDLATPANAPDRAAQREKVLLQCGFTLFSNLDFENAFRYIRQTNVDARELLSMFPSLLPSQFEYTPRFSGGGQITGLVNQVLTQRKRAAVSSFDQSSGSTDFEDLVGEFVQQAMTQLLPYLLHQREQEARPEVLRVIDTAIVNLYLVRGDLPGLLAFFEKPHAASIGDAANALHSRGWTYACAMLYAGLRDASFHAQALQLLEHIGTGQVSDASDAKHDGVTETIDLLQLVDVPDLIWKHAAWVLRREPDAAMAIFTEPKRRTPLPAGKVLEYVHAIDPMLAHRYLEWLIESGNKDEAVHTQLALLYIDSLTGSSGSSMAETCATALRDKLVKLLETSEQYNIGTIAGRLASASLPRASIAVAGRSGDHLSALRTYVHQLGDIAGAEAYCERHWRQAEAKQQQHSETYLTLLKILLLPDPGHREMLDEAQSLMNKHGHHLDPIKVLDLIPADWPVQRVREYLATSLDNMLHRRRTSGIVLGLRRVEHRRVDAQRIACQGSKILVMPHTMCARCYKPIGTAVFVRLLDRRLVHYKCFADATDTAPPVAAFGPR